MSAAETNSLRAAARPALTQLEYMISPCTMAFSLLALQHLAHSIRMDISRRKAGLGCASHLNQCRVYQAPDFQTRPTSTYKSTSVNESGHLDVVNRRLGVLL